MPEIRDSGIQGGLERYSSSARSLVTAKGNRKASHWSIYAAAAGSAVAMSTAADANIIYSGPQNITDSNGYKTFSIAGRRFALGVFHGSFRSGGFSEKGGQVFLRGYSTAHFLLNHTYGLKRLFSGNKVSSHAGSFGYFGFVRQRFTTRFYGYTYINKRGTWSAGQTGFGGVKLGNGEFGWIRLRYEDNANGYPDMITAIDWAYHTDGTIYAGQTPEPSSFSLLALAAGATGVLALRRKKRIGSVDAAQS